VFASIEDPFGTNPDENFEIFLYDVAADALTQLTQTDTGANQTARISGDGTSVYFFSDAKIFDDDPDLPVEFLRIDVATGAITRAGAEAKTYIPCYSDAPAVNRSGDTVVYEARHDELGSNLDFGPELFLLDGRVLPSIVLSGPAPTRVDARAESGAMRFDFLRGDVSNLDQSGGVVDLGPVVCLEDDSPDRFGIGNEDHEDPLPGRAFFYLYRAAFGTKEPGSWGRSTDGGEREAGAGSCDP
jgi:hypothetical protein